MSIKRKYLFFMWLPFFLSSYGGERILKGTKGENLIETDEEMRLGLARKDTICKFLLTDMLPKPKSHPIYLNDSEYSISGDLGKFNPHDHVGIVHCKPQSQETTYIIVTKNKACLVVVDYPGEYFSYFDREHTNWSVGSVLEGQLEDLIEHSISPTSEEASKRENLSVDWWKHGIDAAISKKPEQLSLLVAKYLVFLKERESDPFLKRMECFLPNKLYDAIFQLFQTLRHRDNNNPKLPIGGIDVFLESMDFLSGEYGMEFYELVWKGKSFCFTLGYRNYDENSLPFYIDMLCDSLNIYIQYSDNNIVKCTSEAFMFIIINNMNEILKNELYGTSDF